MFTDSSHVQNAHRNRHKKSFRELKDVERERIRFDTGVYIQDLRGTSLSVRLSG